ncbi:MAG TPA: RsmE family RNA methyltransferase [Kofleriaceae bacterium]|jgi:16S rRNA (uracil1498-N3)-methyltransferase|nr:RsmE family RNA methyltransferase [Kofleriaceae bacterium]
MIRVFVDPAVLAAGELVVRGDEHHYLAHVRRARPGERVELVDGAGRRAAATIARLSAGETALLAEPPEPIAPALPRVRALVPLIKGDRMDACVEKLVEVGVDAVVVWPAARSVARLDDARRDSRLARYRAIAQAAARQSGRAQVPEVTAAPSLAAALADLPAGLRLVLDPASDAGLALALDTGSADDVTIASGPEGGLTPAEHEQLAAFAPLGLGPRVLRADTAPVIAVALIRAATRS